MRRTNSEHDAIEGWEASVRRSGDPATDVFLDQKTFQLAQPLTTGRAFVLSPDEVRISPCGKYVQWRNKKPKHTPEFLLNHVNEFTLDSFVAAVKDNFFKGKTTVTGSLNAFILLSGERQDKGRHKEGPSPQRVIEFVKKWGPLGLRTEVHSADTEEDEAENNAWHSELIDLYRQHAKRMWSLLTVAARINRGQSPTQEEWKSAADNTGLPDAGRLSSDPTYHLSCFMNVHYIESIGFKPTMTTQDNLPILTLDIEIDEETELWDNRRWAWIVDRMTAKATVMIEQELEFNIMHLRDETEKEFRPDSDRPSRLLIFLVLQLVSTMTSGLFRCSICASPYTPTRKPRGEHHYCPDCQSQGHRERSKASYHSRRDKTQ